MTIKIEETLNEIQVAGGIYSAKPIQTTATATFAAQSVTGALSIGGTLAVTGAVTLVGGLTANSLTATGTPTLGSTGTAGYTILGSGGPQIISGTLAPPANPTGVSAPLGSLFINLTATGVTNRVYINTNGATGWTYLSTAGA